MQALFQVRFPRVELYSPHLEVQPEGPPYDQHSYMRHMSAPNGPFLRSLSCARRIFSSGRSTIGAGGWGGWGLLPADLDAHRDAVSHQKGELEAAIAKELPIVDFEWTAELEEKHKSSWSWYPSGTQQDSARKMTIERVLMLLRSDNWTATEQTREAHG